MCKSKEHVFRVGPVYDESMDDKVKVFVIARLRLATVVNRVGHTVGRLEADWTRTQPTTVS